MKRKFLIWIFVATVMLFSLVACGGEATPEDAVSPKEPEHQVEESEPIEEEPSAPTELNLDWDKLLTDLREDPSVNDSFVNDVYVALDDSGYINLTATLYDSTAPEVALEYADTLLRRLNGVAQYQDSTLTSGSKESFGGLYDVYGVMIGIAPLSKTSDTKDWFVLDAIAPGVQCRHTIELQKAYR